MSRSRQYNNIRTSRYGLAGLFTAMLLALPVITLAKTALIETSLGNIEIELLESDAPNTVANFLNYVENDRYNKTFIHRSMPGFIIQGGGFSFINNEASAVDTFSSVDNEFKVSNTRGTVAMAKLGNQPDSATSQWFINLADNSANLDAQNGGFTVFARVIGDGIAVADAISNLPVLDADGNNGSTFDNLPVIDYSSGSIAEANLVMTAVSENQVAPQQPGFVMNAGLNDAWYNPLTNGQGFFITVFPDLDLVNLAWFTYDTDLPGEDEGANLGDAGHRWLTAIGSIEGDSAVLNIDVASGGLFDAATIVQHTDPPGSDGTITLTFADCNSGLVEYNIPSVDRQGSVPIERVANDNIVLCEALSEE
jgi:cyclophilin family peptidyl-prolyl cis-trans isomerase